jgi:heme exporter protein C
MKQNWWKYVTIILLVYTFFFSFYIPLKPGIQNTSTEELFKGPNNAIVVYGYNTKFIQEQPPKVFIQFEDDTKICAFTTTVLDEKKIAFDIEIPDSTPYKLAHLVIQYADNYIFSPNAFRIKGTAKGKITSTCPEHNSSDSTQVVTFPNREILNETIRNLMFHVPMWFVMMFLMAISLVNSIRFLNSPKPIYDVIARNAVKVGVVFALLGIATGSLWARYTWGHWWVDDTKLNGAAITTLVYFAYLILRNSIQEEQLQQKIAAVYNIFAFVILIVMLMILPRMHDSLHPGNGGNPAFSSYDLDNTLRMVFYPAVLGWIGLSAWILNLRIRIDKLKNN